MMKQSRRQFLKFTASALGGVAAAPYIVPASVMGAEAGAVSPSERVTMGIIGCGGRGSDVMGHFLRQKDVQWLAVCDARQERQRGGKQMADGHSGKTDCAAYTDFREMIARPDLDACLIATGCHWHALASIYVARAGKDMYCEKPSTLTVGEGRAMAETMKRLGTVYQAGHQRRSVDSFRFMAEVVRKEMIGKLKSIYMEVWETGPAGPEAPQPVPPGFDYDMWLGWTPWHPYTNARVRGWTNFWDTGGGNMLDMGCHWNDTAQFVHQSDDTVPVEYEGEGVFAPGAFSEVPIRGEWRAAYADGVRLVMHQVGPFEARYIKFIGSDGWIQLVDGTNTVTAEPASILKMRGISAKGWGDAGDHVRNFLDCVKSRNQMTTCHPESAHRATSIGHLGNIAIRLGRKIKFDPKTERIIGDPEADRMLNRPLRPPWHL
jgi:predicted dehydrogenase